jgi:hypothetical protein
MAKMSGGYTLQNFHDTFIALGPLPLPLIRRAMLGETGDLFSRSRPRAPNMNTNQEVGTEKSERQRS